MTLPNDPDSVKIMDARKTGSFIAEKRKEKNMSQRELARSSPWSRAIPLEGFKIFFKI